MSREAPLVVAGIVFSVVAFFHLLRLFYHWEVMTAGWGVPMSVSVFGLIIRYRQISSPSFEGRSLNISLSSLSSPISISQVLKMLSAVN